MKEEFTTELFDVAENVVSRLLDSPLLSQENKEWAKGQTMEDLLAMYIYHKRNLFQSTYS